jgi:hypothetical protein
MALRQPSIDALLAKSDHRQKAIERLPTDPVKQYMTAVKKVKRRAKTTPSEIFTDDITAETYGERLFNKLLVGLESHNLSTLHLALRHYDWLVPGKDASPELLAIFDQLSIAAPTVPHVDISRIMTMEESTITSPPGVDGLQYFYVREFVLTRQELRDLVNYMRKSDDGFVECGEWDSMLQLSGDRFDTWTLRYVGTVEGPRRPIDRFNADLAYQLTNILGETCRAIETIHPHVIRNAKVYLLPDATISPEAGRKVDDTERLLIELFHHPSLLNRLRGGLRSGYVPTQDEVDEFTALKADVWQTFKSGAEMIPDDMQDNLIAHFEKVQEYANNYPAETGTEMHPFTDGARQTAFMEGRPSQFQGTTVLAFLGKDITVTEFTKAQSFWQGGSQAGELTKGILQRIADAETDSHGRGYRRIIQDQLSLWCFANLWPWLWHKNQAQAMFFLCDYLNIIRPLIVVSYSRPVNSVTRANFQHDGGVRMGGTSPFTEIVGVPSIQFYDHKDHDSETHEECAYINIPHNDPGRDKYGQQDVRLRRLLEITMQETFVIVDLALKALNKHAADETPPTRLDLCKEILDERASLNGTSEYKTFSDSLVKARAQCKRYFSTKVRSSTDDVRPVLDTDGRLTLLGLGRAEGLPDSNERAQQLDDLWQLNKPDLHIHIANEPANKDSWISTFMGLQTGQYLYLAALACCDPDDYITNLFDKFAPPGSDKLWFQDQRARGTAVINAGLWVTLQLEQENDELKKPSLKVHFTSAYIPASEMQNSPIGLVQSNGVARIRWKKDQDTQLTIPICSKISIPKHVQESRVIHFTPEGLDILDSSGKAFRGLGKHGQPISATIPRTQFGDKPDLILLWRAVLKAEGIPIPDDEEGDDLNFDWGPMGVAALSNKIKSMQPQQNRPIPDPADANYVLYKFLDEPDFRYGGVFNTSIPADKVGVPDHMKHFVEFLKDRQWAQHPYRDWWLSNFDREKPETGILAKNIPIYRSCKRRYRQYNSLIRKSKTGLKPMAIRAITFEIGPPDSAFDDPFDEQHEQSCVVDLPKKKKKVIEDEEEDGDEAEGSGAAAGKGKKPAKQTSKRRPAMGGAGSKASASASAVDDDDAEAEETANPRRSPRKKVVPAVVEDEDGQDEF